MSENIQECRGKYFFMYCWEITKQIFPSQESGKK